MRSACLTSIGVMLMSGAALAQPPYATDAAPIAKDRQQEYFIEVLAERRVTNLPPGPLYWRIEQFSTASGARAAATSFSLPAEAGGRHWLFTLGPAVQQFSRGRVVAEIGPVVAPAARTFLLRINRAGGPPGSQTPVHTHPGSEAIFVLNGEVTQRTTHGTERASAGQTLNAHRSEMVMQLTSSGDVDLEQVVMFLVDAERPFSPPAKF